MRRTVIGALAAAGVLACSGTALASVPAHPSWKSSNPHGTWNNGGFVVYNNAWNGSAGPQTAWAYSYHHMGAESTQAKGNTAVESYPCVGKVYQNVRVSSLRLIRNGFSESMPTHLGLAAEAADDVWLNSYRIEVMIWVDNRGQRITDTLIGHATIYRQHFNVWRNGSEYIFALNQRETSGVTHILSAIRWLIRHGSIPANVTLSQVDFGWEISSTDGKPLDFVLTNYWLHTNS